MLRLYCLDVQIARVRERVDLFCKLLVVSVFAVDVLHHEAYSAVGRHQVVKRFAAS